MADPRAYGGYGGAASPSPSLDSVEISPQSSPVHDYGVSSGGGGDGGGSGMRRRHVGQTGANGQYDRRQQPYGDDDKYRKSKRAVRRLDMFPKVQEDYQVRSDRGGLVTLVGYGIAVVLVLAEFASWSGERGRVVEHTFVDTSLNKRMRVDMNITFPSLHCDDLHLDAMDVAGDSQLNIVDTLVKKRLHLDGSILSAEEIRVEANKNSQKDKEREQLKDRKLPDDYCGSCYGAQEKEGDCCNTCDEVMNAYKRKRWGSQDVIRTAEQCQREGKADKMEPKRMSKGEGCNLSGYMMFSRVAGNFHIAMGEGVERDGRHIHQFLPEDSINFNASHVIHKLSFGPDYGLDDVRGRTSLDGVSKIVTEQNGSTGLFQYFVKIVPTTYKGFSEGRVLETNRYFFTERFRPLMTDVIEEAHHDLGGKDGLAGAHVGGAVGSGSHAAQEHHKVQNSLLPGVFFVYEIYPFAVEVTIQSVPFTHLLIRIMAIVGGTFTVMGQLMNLLGDGKKHRRRG